MKHAPSPSDLERTVALPETKQIPRPETLRLRSRLDDVMARLRKKLDGINGEQAKRIGSRLDVKATRMACAAFADIEEDADDAA